MTTKFSENIFSNTEETKLITDNNLIRSIASNIINKNECQYDIGVECFYCWHEAMNDLRIWTLVKNNHEYYKCAVFSSLIIECLYPAVLKMINKVNEFNDFDFLFSKNYNEISYQDSKYIFSNKLNKTDKFLIAENIDLYDQSLDSIDALVKINIIKNRYSQEYFYISNNCNHI
tara:strand:- start:33 stop:554 length:522 start_codon:yes stop_codon:yes gene_type:complete